MSTRAEEAFYESCARMYDEHEESAEKARKCIQELRDRPDMPDGHRRRLVETILWCWDDLPNPFLHDADQELDLARSFGELVGDPDEFRAMIEQEHAEDRASVLKELGTTDEELKQLFGGHAQGFFPKQ